MGIFKDRTGEIVINNEKDVAKKGWRWMEIIAYRGATDIDVLIDGKYIRTGLKYGSFIDRSIKNKYHKSVCGLGYIGEGNYLAQKHGIHSVHYNTWRNMIKRCYDEKTKKKHPSYENCTIADEWLCYQNFAAWSDENIYAVDGEKICIDKDILFKGNKLYSENTCIYVPLRINNLFLKGGAAKSALPIGVHASPNKKRYSVLFNCKQLGTYDTPEEAFAVYKAAKEAYIRKVMRSYIGKIPEHHYKKLRKALYSYEISIDD